MVTWNWKKKMGSCKWYCNDGTTTKVNIYVGNCLGVFILDYKDEETKEEKYQFVTFFNDEQHLKNCLGLSKGYKEDIMKNRIKSLKLNTYYKASLEMGVLFAKAGYKVELYYKENKRKKKD